MEPSIAVLEVEEVPRQRPFLRTLWRPDIAAASLLLASIVALAVVQLVPANGERSGTNMVLHAGVQDALPTSWRAHHGNPLEHGIHEGAHAHHGNPLEHGLDGDAHAEKSPAQVPNELPAGNADEQRKKWVIEQVKNLRGHHGNPLEHGIHEGAHAHHGNPLEHGIHEDAHAHHGNPLEHTLQEDAPEEIPKLPPNADGNHPVDADAKKADKSLFDGPWDSPWDGEWGVLGPKKDRPEQQ